MVIPSAAIICACRYKGRCQAYFETTMSATKASVDQPGRSRHLDDAGRVIGAGPFAGPAGILRSPCHDHPVLRRDLVEPLGAILTDDVQIPTATGAALGWRLDDDLL